MTQLYAWDIHAAINWQMNLNGTLVTLVPPLTSQDAWTIEGGSGTDPHHKLKTEDTNGNSIIIDTSKDFAVSCTLSHTFTGRPPLGDSITYGSISIKIRNNNDASINLVQISDQITFNNIISIQTTNPVEGTITLSSATFPEDTRSSLSDSITYRLEKNGIKLETYKNGSLIGSANHNWDPSPASINIVGRTPWTNNLHGQDGEHSAIASISNILLWLPVPPPETPTITEATAGAQEPVVGSGIIVKRLKKPPMPITRHKKGVLWRY